MVHKSLIAGFINEVLKMCIIVNIKSSLILTHRTCPASSSNSEGQKPTRFIYFNPGATRLILQADLVNQEKYIFCPRSHPHPYSWFSV